MLTKPKSLDVAFKNQKRQIHTCGFYSTDEERLRILANYYKVGLLHNELCVFVTDQKPEELVEDLKRYGLNVKRALQEGDFRVYPIKPTYLTDGTFKTVAMLDNLKGFVKNALALGYSGVRGGGDMEWITSRPPGWENVGEYEAKINRFIRTNRFTGICLFPKDLLDKQYTRQIIQTHQEMVRGGILHHNPHYKPTAVLKGLNTEIMTQMDQIDNWLAHLDQQKTMAPSGQTL